MVEGARQRYRRTARAAAIVVLTAVAPLLLAPTAAAGQGSEPPPVDPRYEALEGLIRSFQTDNPVLREATQEIPDPPPPIDPVRGDPIDPATIPFADHQPMSWGHVRVQGEAADLAPLFPCAEGPPFFCSEPFCHPPGTTPETCIPQLGDGVVNLDILFIGTGGDVSAGTEGRGFNFGFDLDSQASGMRTDGQPTPVDCASNIFIGSTFSGVDTSVWDPVANQWVTTPAPLFGASHPGGGVLVFPPGHPCTTADPRGLSLNTFAFGGGEFVEFPSSPIDDLFTPGDPLLVDLTQPYQTMTDEPPGANTVTATGPVSTSDDGFPFGLLLGAGAGLAALGGGALVYDRGQKRLEDTAPEDLNFMQVFLEGFSRSGQEKETANLDTRLHVTQANETAVQDRLQREYAHLTTQANAALGDYLSAMRRFQDAYVNALSGSTELQGLLRQFAEARGIAQKQDIAFAIVTLVRGLGTLAYRGAQWVRTTRAAGTTRAGAGGAQAGTGGAQALSGGADALAAGGTAAAQRAAHAQRLATNARNIPRVPGMHDVFMHGDSVHGFVFQNTFMGWWRKMSPRRLAEHIRRSGWKPGMPVRLFSCHSASNGSAAALAKELGTWVSAPTMKIWINAAGKIFHDPGGFTILFDPQGIARFVLVNGAKIPLKG